MIEERKKAEDIYDDAIATEKETMPILAQTVTRDNRNLIKVSMGNFPPNSKATLVCTMHAKLPLINDEYNLRIPICYIPGNLRNL